MKGKNVKTKKKTVKAKKVSKKAKSLKKKKVRIDKAVGSSLADWVQEVANQHRLVTEQCGCTPEKGCLDPEPIEFKDHQVHGGLDNEAELTSESTEIRNEEPKNPHASHRTRIHYFLKEEDIDFNDRQVHGGLDMFSSLEHSEDKMQVSEEFKAKMEYLSKGLLGRFFYRIGKFFSKPKP